MRVRYICGCGLQNHTKDDWTCHWEHGLPREDKFLGKWPKLRAVWLFLNTRVELTNKDTKGS